MPWVRKFERDRTESGTFRETRIDAKIGNKAPDLCNALGCNKNKTVGSVLRDTHTASLSQLRKKIWPGD